MVQTACNQCGNAIEDDKMKKIQSGEGVSLVCPDCLARFLSMFDSSPKMGFSRPRPKSNSDIQAPYL